jgi:hypothetical protein
MPASAVQLGPRAPAIRFVAGQPFVLVDVCCCSRRRARAADDDGFARASLRYAAALAGELKEALGGYPGAVVVASHDRWLCRRWSGAELSLP